MNHQDNYHSQQHPHLQPAQQDENAHDTKIRLQKFLASAGIASRRSCEKLITAGRVRVNGQTVTVLGTRIDPRLDKVTIDQQPVRQTDKLYYYLLNKPLGVVSSVTDPQGRRTVTDLIPDCPVRIYPVGRLDIDTKGLLLLTNDGALTNSLIHPHSEINKTYVALVQGIPSAKALEQLRHGLKLEDGWTYPAEVQARVNSQGNTWLTIIIHEGRNRQVRRMCAAIGYPVLRLERTGFAFLHLNGLQSGAYRQLTPAEISRLQALAKM